MEFNDVIEFGEASELSKGPVSSGDPVTPLLVGLYDAHRAYEDGRKDSLKQDLCDHMTDLLSAVSRVSDREMITDVLVSLLKQSERDLKAALSERLSTLPNVPLRLVLQLANDDLSVAKPVLQNSPVLNDLDLLYIIQSRESSFWQVIAARKALNENVVDALADTHDIPTAKVLVHNDTISFSNHASCVIGDMAIADDTLAEPLLMRRDIPKEVARKLYAYVGEEIKTMIEEKFSISASEIVETLDDVIAEFVETPHLPGVCLPTTAMLRAAEMFLKQQKLTPSLMIRTLKRGQISSFVAQFSAFVGLPVAVVVPMLQQSNGQGLAVVSRANGLSKEEYMSIFMLTRKISSESGVVEAAHFNRAVAYFDRITPELANKIMKRSRH